MNYDFSVLTEKLQKLNFSEQSTLKFTFDVDKAFEMTKGKNYSVSMINICNLDYDRMITQKSF